jgi:glycosyltransferase involved in cell wall biosynthesis
VKGDNATPRRAPTGWTENIQADGGARISVVIPAYNRADFIKATVESVLAQTLRPAEVIIVDDGSTDHTPDVCAQFAAPVKSLRLQNSGPAAARNAGIHAATGDWIAFCDSDDLWDPHKLELEMRVLEATNTEWCISDFRIIDPEGRPVRSETPGLTQAFPVLQQRGVTPESHFARWLSVTKVPWQSSEVTVYHGDMFGMLFLGNVVLPTTAVVSRALIERGGAFDVSFRRAEDTEFFHRLSGYGDGAILLTKLASYRVGHPSFMTSDPAPFIEFTLRSLNEAAARRAPLSAEERAAYRKGRRQLRERLAYTRLTAFDGAGARRALLENWRDDRAFSLRGAAVIAASFLPASMLRGMHRAKRATRRWR